MGAALLSLPACQTLEGIGPEPTRLDAKAEVPVLPDWVEPAPNELPSTDWVAEFQSPLLTQFVDNALERNATIGQNEAQFEAALAAIRTSRSSLFPSIGASGGVTRSRGGVDFNAGSTSYNLGLNASWEADLFGRIRDQVSSAEAGAMASSADLAGVRLSIAGQVAQAYFNIIEASLLVDLSAREIDTQARALRLTQRRFDNGISGSSDVRLARSAVANAEAVQASRLQNRDRLIRGLKVLLREYPDASLDVPADLPDLPVLTGAASPAYLLQKRPDILAAERRIAESGLNVDVARKALYPSLSFSGGISESILSSSQNPDFDIFDLFDLKELAKRLTASLTAPIFQGGRLDAQIDSQMATLTGRVESYVGTVLTAYQEVENALDAEGRLAEREAALRDSLQESRLAEERLEDRYVEGLATILQLLDAQSRRLNAEGQLISARTERLNNRVRMHVAFGGGEYGSEQQPVLEEQEGFLDLIMPENILPAN
jgi:NodT family efflux transporter outer membrane factor (OMF) lipoprotein